MWRIRTTDIEKGQKDDKRTQIPWSRIPWFERRYITLILRAQELNTAILNSQKPIYRLRKLPAYQPPGSASYAYVVTLRKCPDRPLIQRVQSFRDFLLGELIPAESLDYADKCFTVKGDGYVITYCLEAYKKNANQIGFFCDGMPASEVPHRMGCEAAFRWLRRNCSEKECSDIFALANSREMAAAYPNPADCFIQSVNIAKAQRKDLYLMTHRKRKSPDI